MRIAIYSDVHANLEAFRAIVDDALEQRCTKFICLGDIVGYNADPEACVELVRTLGGPVVKGNHDEYASLDQVAKDITPRAEVALRWTRNQLSDDSKTWLAQQKLVGQVDHFTIVHATLDMPEKWGYVFNNLDAAASFSYQTTPVAFFGHTHASRAYLRSEKVESIALDKLRIVPGQKYFINVGSVGQPRDGDWRAAYVVYDLDNRWVELRRVDYDIGTAQQKVQDSGLPRRLRDL